MILALQNHSPACFLRLIFFSILAMNNLDPFLYLFFILYSYRASSSYSMNFHSFYNLFTMEKVPTEHSHASCPAFSELYRRIHTASFRQEISVNATCHCKMENLQPRGNVPCYSEPVEIVIVSFGMVLQQNRNFVLEIRTQALSKESANLCHAYLF